MDYNDVWQKTIKQLELELGNTPVNLFFKNTHLKTVEENGENKIVTIASPNAFIKQTLEGKYLKSLHQTLGLILNSQCVINLIIEEEISPKNNSLGQETPLFSEATENYLKQQNQDNILKNNISRGGLNKDYTFENFAVSPTNEVAYAAAIAVAKNPGKAYNPLFLYGDVGVGKTHLMQAVAIRILQNEPETKLKYCMSETFTNEIIEAIRGKNTPKFRNKYRKVNILLIDDIQFIAGKNTVQEEFFHTFNEIRAAGGQIILTSDRPPHEIKLLEDRLRSRFEEGLTIDIQTPNFELRTAILLIKAKQMQKDLPMDIAQIIAKHITSTRKLQGFLSQVYAIQEIKPTETLKNIVLQKLNQEIPAEKNLKPRVYINPKEIVSGVSKYFDLSINALYGPKRSKPIVVPRQFAMYLLKHDLNMPYTEIGMMFGGRDHTTVMHAVEKIDKLANKSENIREEISSLRQKIYG
ncbi:chromosomal replication initiator protein DnaA [Candidatus Beckwithbacteria bacterium]|nr:chromosomal replication initiator protein DnaA [Candidatus Beckwithbacteria bacterium]